MKKVILINIQGIVFHVDEDAHETIQDYLQEVQEYFSHVEFGDEIYNDFEWRLTELLKDKLSKNKEVITLIDVEGAIKTLGKVSDFDKTQQEGSHTNRKQTTRKLYRDPEHATFGGVAAGIATYLNVDIVWIRLAFVIALFLNGLGLIAYLIMWIIVPKARTIVQRMEMKGEPLLFENIEHNVREEYEKVRRNFEIVFNKTSLGASHYDAGINADNINYNWDIEDHSLYFDESYYLQPGRYFRAQQLSIDVYIPIGTTVWLDDSMHRMTAYPNPTADYHFNHKHDYWRMTRDGIQTK